MRRVLRFNDGSKHEDECPPAEAYVLSVRYRDAHGYNQIPRERTFYLSESFTTRDLLVYIEECATTDQ